MPSTSSHRDLSRSHPTPRSSRDLSALTTREHDQLRKSNASIRLTRWEAVKRFFWDSEDRTVCYRTGTSWLFIVSFYPAFVALIVALFFGVMILMKHCIKTYALEPIINKHSLTKEPLYS